MGYYPFPFRFGPGICCCPTGCFDDVDDFNRADSDDIGDDWLELVGEWEISGFMLHEKTGGGGTADAIAFWTGQFPARSAGEMSISVWVYNHNIGDIFRIYPACTDLGTVGPVYVEYEKMSESAWEVRLIGTTLCADTEVTQLAAYDENGGVQLGVCVDAEVGMIIAGITAMPDNPGIWCDTEDAGNGRWVAIGHDNPENGAWFDLFSFTELRTPDEICSNCVCACLDYPPSKDLTGSFTDAVHRASCMNQTWDMTWEWNGGMSRWYGEVTVDDTGTQGGLDTDLAFTLECTDNDPENVDWPGHNFVLNFVSGLGCLDANTNGGGPYLPDPDKSTCHPFSLVFGPFYLACHSMECFICWPPLHPDNGDPLFPGCDTEDENFEGEYWITITE